VYLRNYLGVGKRGPKSRHPSGFGHTTPKGYHRALLGGRQRFVHDWIWEQAHGPIPGGYEVHHANGDKQDNRLENLRLVDDLTHKRLDSPHYRERDGRWERRCSICGEWKPATAEHFYLTREGWIAYGRCRPCHIARVVRDKQQRRAKSLP
jgi:hypothetical protein